MRTLCAATLVVAFVWLAVDLRPRAVPRAAVALKCVGADPCPACSNCRRCEHCRDGRTCGTCKAKRQPAMLDVAVEVCR
jgi:hypothetical protein